MGSGPSFRSRQDPTGISGWLPEECHALGAGVQAVPAGRRFVRERLAAAGADALVDDAALVASELLANAVQHGEPPVSIRVRATPELVQIEVEDASPRSPVRTLPSTSNMTGRGLLLIEALVRAWGVRREPSGGKTVWCEIVPTTEVQRPPELDINRILTSWDDDPVGAEDRFTVVLGDVPTDLLISAKAHIDNLVRELSLAAQGREFDGGRVPEHLTRLIETVVHGFADARAAIKRQALVAAQRGEPRTSLTLHLPLSAADAGEAYLSALDEADAYARAARLLTLETPPDHRVFRRWYVGEVIDQLRRLARGEPVDTAMRFEERLLGEVRRLANAQRMSDQAARLQRVTAALARARTPEDVANVVLSEGVGALGASGGSLLVPADDGVHLAVPGAVGYAGELLGQLRSERADAPLPAATAMRTSEPIWVESRQERDARFPLLAGFEPETAAMCAVPLVVADRAIGALRFSFDTRKLFDEDERGFVLALAALTAQTLERTELYQSERQAALQLQRQLLPTDFATGSDWDVFAYYSPAGDQQIGGDFYDVLRLTDGRIAAVVGDVMGRGLQAAAAMAQVRSTIRAYVLDDPTPDLVFHRVDAFFAALDLDQLVTAIYLLAERDGETISIVNAGHLPPLLINRDAATSVEAPPGLPFGAGGDTRTVTTLRLPPGAFLLVVTDGLVEHRGEDIDAGIDRVLAAARTARAESSKTLVDYVIESSAAQHVHDDDVTVVALRRNPRD